VHSKRGNNDSNPHDRYKTIAHDRMFPA